MRDSHAARFEMQAGDFFIVSRAKKYDPNQPRGSKGTSEGGRWVKGSAGKEFWVGKPPEDIDGRSFTSEEGYQWHEQGPGATWAKKLPYKDAKVIDNYSGFGYKNTNELRRGTYKTPIVSHFVRAATPEEMRRVGWDTEKNEWVPSIKVKEGEYKPGYPVDPRDAVTPESIERFGHPLNKSDVTRYHPDDPQHRVDDGRIIVNAHYRPVEGGPTMMFSIQRAGPDLKRLDELTKEADHLDDLIANRGLVLDEAIEVQRGAYLPGVSPDDLEAMVGQEHLEKAFTSTFLGEAERRAHSYPALGKWESIMQRHGSGTNVLVKHQDEVGTAVRFYITLPKGTKVASVESVRRLRHEFPRIPNPEPMGPEELADPFWQKNPNLWQVTDYTQEPTVDAEDIEKGKEGRRSESEILLGSGARFRVKRVKKGYTYKMNDPLLKPVEVYEVHMEYIGGGSSQGAQ